MTNDKTLLAVWKENLITELKQSLLWDAIPYDDMHRVDFTELEPNDHQFPFRWMRNLLDKHTNEVTFSPVPSLAKKIQHLYYESQNYQREHGIYPLRFGYPLFIQKDADEPNKYIAAPIFLWDLHLRPDPIQPGDWILERKYKAPIRFNPLLSYHLQKEYQLDLTDLVDRALTDGHASQLDVLKICNEIALKAGFEGNSSTTNAIAMPKEQELVDILMDDGAIRWSGVVGLFYPQSVRTLQVLDEELSKPATIDDATVAPIEEEDFRAFDFSPLATNPYQSAIVRGLDNAKKIVVTGGQGTGKTHTATALIANLLANRKKTLVISNKVNALKSVQNRLDKLGLGELTFIINNPIQNKRDLAEAIYQTSLSVRKLPLYEEEDFQHLLNRTTRYRNRLDKAHELLSTPLFDDATWTEMVGLFIKNQKKEGKHLLNSHLKSTDYEYSQMEYEAIIAKIERAELLYSELNTMKHPLRVLHSDIFTDKNHEDAKSFTYDTLSKILDEVNEVYRQFVMQLEAYANELNGNFETYYQSLKGKIKEVRADIEDYKQQYGEDFNKFGALRKLRMQLFGVFSKRLTNILEIKNEVKSDYDDIEGSFEHQRYFAYSFPKTRGSVTFDKLNDNLDDFEQALEEWKAGTPNIIQQELERLDLENINEQVQFKSTIERLNQSFTELLSRVNGYQLYQKKFHSEAGTLVKKREYLEEMTENLENLQYNLRDFDAYYFWTNFWLGLDNAQQSVVKSLITTKPKNWVAAFNSWYFHSLLTKQFNANLLADKKPIEDYVSLCQELNDFLPKKALKYWKLKQANDIRRVRRESKFLYNAFFGKSRERFVDELNVKVLFESEFEMLTNMFPVLLMPPAMASNWLPLVEKYFDLVIVDNAESVQTEDAVGALWRGKRHLLLGDELKVAKRMTASVLAYGKQGGYQRMKLPFYHEATDEKIWNFKNAAFYNNQLQIIPSQKLSSVEPLKLVTVEGVYIPNNNINEEEAQQVMHLLNEIEPNKTGRFPSVGIVCMTKAQRNLVTYYITQIKQRKTAGNERIMQLELGGLGVYHYRDIQHHQFDIMILATTYGVDVQDKFSDDILELNENESLQSLNALLSVATEKVYLLSSIPQTYLDHFAKYNNASKGVHILANLICYAKAIGEDDGATQADICNRLLELHKDKNATSNAENTYVNEVAEAIYPYLERGRLSVNQQIDGIQVDMLIEPIHVGQPRLALQSDGSFWRFPKSDYTWEKALETELQAVNIQYLPIWSLEFWKSPDMAVKQLASMIIKYDDHYLPKPPVIVDAQVEDEVESDDSEEINEEVLGLATESNE